MHRHKSDVSGLVESDAGRGTNHVNRRGNMRGKARCKSHGREMGNGERFCEEGDFGGGGAGHR